MDSGSFFDIKKLNLTPEEIYILGNSIYGLKNNLEKLPCKEWSGAVKKIACTAYNDADQKDYENIIHEALGKTLMLLSIKHSLNLLKQNFANSHVALQIILIIC